MSHFQRSMALTPAAAESSALETVRPASALGGTNGIRIGPDRRLWMCEALMQRISSIDVDTGEISTVIAREDGALVAPDDLAFDSEGSCYITDSHRITVRRPDATIHTLTDQLIASNGITVDAEDRLLVNEFRPGGRVMEIDRYSGEIRIIIDSIDYPNACERGADGRLYLQNVLAGTVSAVDIETGKVEQIADGFEQIPSVRFGPNGQLFVAEAIRGRISEFDPATGERRVIVHMPLGGIDNFVFDVDGTMYVSSYTTGCILKVPAPYTDPEILSPPGLVSIAGIAAAPGGSILVANTFNIPLVTPDGDFTQWSPWTPSGPEDMVLGAWPVDDDRAYALASNGQVLLVERGQAASALFAAAADPRTRSSVVLVDEGAVAIGDSDGHLLVGQANGDVLLFAPNGTPAVVATGASAITAVAGTGDVVATADAESGTVTVGRDGAATVLDGFARPTAVTFAAGALYVAEHRARRVVRCDLESGTREIMAWDLPFGWPVPEPPPIGNATLATAADGSVLIGCDGDGSIRRLTPDRA